MGSAAATPPAASQDAGSVPWRITGDWWDLCNCAIGCPCVFGSALGYCEGVLTWLIDDRASPDQREALETVFTGKAGGIFEAWHDLTISVDGVEFVPMNVSHDGEAWRVEVPGLWKAWAAPHRKYRVPENDTCRIYNAPRPEVSPGHIRLGQALRNIVTGAFGRNFDWSQRSSKHIAFDLRGPEVFTWRKPG